jgi:hypothetical protein
MPTDKITNMNKIKVVGDEASEASESFSNG